MVEVKFLSFSFSFSFSFIINFVINFINSTRLQAVRYGAESHLCICKVSWNAE